MRLSADGDLSYQGEPVTHPRVQSLFHRGVVVRADGEVILQVGEQWAYLECETVAHFVERLATDERGLLVTFRGGEARSCPEPRLGMAPDSRFYLWSSRGEAPSVLLRLAHHQVAEALEEDASAGAVFVAGALRLPVEELTGIPGVADRWAGQDGP
ncbi:MAG: hypothetical protein VX938_09000 [Myxococcota bacterium]|nr:hypothetical protein [Myxococcota bacterium]